MAVATPEYDYCIAFWDSRQILHDIGLLQSGEQKSRQFRSTDDADPQRQAAGEQRLTFVFSSDGPVAGDQQNGPNKTDRLEQPANRLGQKIHHAAGMLG